jgi:hypothetical protein
VSTLWLGQWPRRVVTAPPAAITSTFWVRESYSALVVK